MRPYTACYPQMHQIRRKEAREKRTIIGLFLTAGIYLLGLFISVYQVSLTRRSISDAETNSTQQAINTQTALSLTKQAADAVTQQAVLLKESNTTAANTLVANARAWVGPVHAFSPQPIINTDLETTIQYVNMGREPNTRPSKSSASSCSNVPGHLMSNLPPLE